MQKFQTSQCLEITTVIQRTTLSRSPSGGSVHLAILRTLRDQKQRGLVAPCNNHYESTALQLNLMRILVSNLFHSLPRQLKTIQTIQEVLNEDQRRSNIGDEDVAETQN